MLSHGVRDFIVQKMKTRPIGGSIYRSNLQDYGQCIIIRAAGTRQSLESFETEVLSMTDDNGDAFWEYTKQYKPDEAIYRLSTYTFTIIQSTRGAIRGPNSNPVYDNQSDKSANTGKSSKSH